jgi:triphosphatase
MDRPSGFSPAKGPATGRPRLRLVADNGPCGAPADRPKGAVKARRMALDPRIALDDALAAVLSSCIDHFAANAPLLHRIGDAEAVRQLRVSLRRLRAFLSLLRGEACVEGLDEIAGRAKAIAGFLAEGRDWDVFRESVERRLDSGPPMDPGFVALLDAVELRRRRETEIARAALTPSAIAEFACDLRKLLAQRPWRDSVEGCRAQGSARIFAVAALARLHRRAGRKCEGLERSTPERRHEARKALKKIRYAAEFFQSLFAKKGTRAYLVGLAVAQDLLGQENDRATASSLLAALENAETARAVWYLRGWSAAAAALGESPTLEASRRLNKLEPFWR